MIFRLNSITATLLVCCVSGAAASVDRARIDTGELQGVVAGKVVSFKGIPFAAPPVGANRWRPPQPPQPWTGVRSAAEFAGDCMQLPFPSDAAPLGTKPSEDCLYANVWAPVERASSRLPVMVWIYGGGFVNGGSSPAVYDGSHFAERGLVLVSFNYRVGRFGFFAHPALSRENSAGPLGNYAFMDQIAALKWVARNIAAFGGDPHNVTLFGESAGGISVLTLMTSPLSRGLFQRAIVESGGGRKNLMPMRRLLESLPNLPSAEDVGLAFAKQVGIEGKDEAALAALRKLPPERLVNGLNLASMGTQNGTYSGPMLDGKLIVEEPQDAFARGHFMHIPFIGGANSLDIGFSHAQTMEEVFASFAGDREKAKAAYNPGNSKDVKAIGYSVAADRMMIEPARFIVRAVAAAGQPAFEYRFSYVATSMRKEWPGAPHASEIPFVFDTVSARYGKELTPEDESLARTANAYWASFAKSGHPRARGLPDWPAYNPSADILLNFTNNGPVAQPDPWRQRLDLTERVAGAGQ